MAVRELSVSEVGRAIGRRWPPLIRELASFDTFPDRVVSLYLDVCWDDEQQRERARLGIKDQVKRLRAGLDGGAYEATEAVRRDLERALAYVEERTHVEAPPNVRGEALFFSAAGGFERGMRSPFRLPNLVTVAPTPAIRPLLGVLPAAGPVLCALSDSASTRLFRLDGDGAGTIAVIEGAIPRHHHAGGWSQLKLQHARLEEVSRLHKEAAEWIARFVASEERARVLLGGRPEAITDLVAYLPKAAKERLHVVGEVTANAPEASALAAFARELSRLQREEAQGAVADVEDAAGAGLRGAVGVRAVIDAVNEGRCGDLLLSDLLCRDAHRCARCRVIGDGEAATCAACGGPPEAIELGEALAHAAVLQDAGVTIVPSPSPLDLDDGVAARLRY